MQKRKTINIRMLVLVAVLAALVFVLSSLEILVPIVPGDGGRIHFGNIMCLLSGVLFGPLVGGMAAGLGSMLYDFTHPLYISEFWITFIMKFAMGWLAGWLATRPLKKLPGVPRYLVAALGGQLLYFVLYLLKSTIMTHYIYGTPWEGVGLVVAGKALTSGINGLIAVVASTLLAPALHAGLKAAGFYRRYGSRPAEHPTG